ncbi:DinB family protein [Paenibacillus sp.]|uniref:DinB family protein n=1 Tax=Paenibacillus sp. TaxID=58172 RepID=UPI0037CBD549
MNQLRTPYRMNGWTIQQIIHHMADNDMNAYLRFKRALTEDTPTATSYREDLWGDLHDYFDTDIETSIVLLETLHKRFYKLLIKLNSDQFNRMLRTQAFGLINLETAQPHRGRTSWLKVVGRREYGNVIGNLRVGIAGIIGNQ